jgi:hypothetical protein
MRTKQIGRIEEFLTLNQFDIPSIDWKWNFIGYVSKSCDDGRFRLNDPSLCQKHESFADGFDILHFQLVFFHSVWLSD